MFISGNGWKLISGSVEGQTQECCDSYEKQSVWDHPIDLHYTTQTLQGSPKLLLQIFCRDNHGRILFVGYGVVTIPLTPGHHELKCFTWKPIGTSIILSFESFIFVFLYMIHFHFVFLSVLQFFSPIFSRNIKIVVFFL